MVVKSKPYIHLWIYNHPFWGICDQLQFFKSIFEQEGYEVSIGRTPSLTALNVVIENFTPYTRDILINFCNMNNKSVAVIMTEHLDMNISNGDLLVHGEPILNNNNDYMHPITQLKRIQHLVEILPYIRGFFTLGDLPKLRNITHMLPGTTIKTIPFPKLEKQKPLQSSINNDFLFTGNDTSYRKNIRTLLDQNNFSNIHPGKIVSKKVRHSMTIATKIVLNIPQNEQWEWLSTMRIVAALRSGRATISLGTKDSSEIAKCCTQLNMKDSKWIEQLRYQMQHWEKLYLDSYCNYCKMASAFQTRNPFPHQFFEYWSLIEP